MLRSHAIIFSLVMSVWRRCARDVQAASHCIDDFTVSSFYFWWVFVKFTQVHERFFPLSWWNALFAAAAALHFELDAFEGGSSDSGQWTITASLCFFFNSSLDLIDKVITSNNCIIISSVDVYLLFSLPQSHKKVSWNNNEARLSVQSVALYQSPSSRDLGIGASAGPLTSVSGWHPIRVLSVLELVSGATLGLENQLQVV